MIKKVVSIGLLIWLASELLTLGYAQPNIPKEKIPSDISVEVNEQIERLYSSEPEERIRATEKLEMMGDEAIPAIPFLTGMLGDDATITRAGTPGGSAARALSMIGSRSAVDSLIEALKSDDSITRKNAAYGLRYSFRKDPRTIEPLMAVLRDKDSGVRSNAAQALGGIKDVRTIEPLITLLKDENQDVRLGAAEALEKTTENHFFEQDFEKWQSWWKKNKKIVLKKDFNVNIERQPDQEDNIREAVFYYLFQHNESGQQQRAKVYFLSLRSDFHTKDSDHNDEFMEHFRNHKPPVKKVSQCTYEGTFTDKETGENGLIFYTAGIKWLSQNEVEVKGGYHEANLSGSGNTYYVIRENGRWIVKRVQLGWIS